MAKGDLFKRSLEAGTSFIDMTRERAEAVVRDWVEAGDLGKGRAPKAVEQVLDRSRKVTDELRGLIRREIANQLAALGVATRDDLARLEAKIDAASASPAPSMPATPAPRASTRAAPVNKSPANVQPKPSTSAPAGDPRPTAASKKAASPGTKKAAVTAKGAAAPPAKAGKAAKATKATKVVGAGEAATPGPSGGAGSAPGT